MQSSTVKPRRHGIIRASITLIFLAGLMPTGCLTTRKNPPVYPHMLTSAHQARAWGETTWHDWLNAYPVQPDWHDKQQTVQAVGRQLVAHVGREQYEWEWEFALVANEQALVFCLPGGKTGISTAALATVRNEAELAVLLAHAVAHTVAGHGGERLFQPAIVHLDQHLTTPVPPTTLIQWQRLLAYVGMTWNGFAAPFTSMQEIVADELALRYLTQAGYDPRAALILWQRLGTTASTQPSMLQVIHPLSPERLKRLQERISP